MKDLDGTILTWNKSAERMYGYRPDEVIGKNVSMLLAPDRPQEAREILQRLSLGEKIERYETRRRTKDGHILYVSLTISPVRDQHGKVVGGLREEVHRDGHHVLDRRVAGLVAEVVPDTRAVRQ